MTSLFSAFVRSIYICIILAFTSPAQAQMQRVLAVDGGFGQPMAAFAVMVPQGWQANGGVFWNSQVSACNRYGFNFNWSAMSPDLKYGVGLLPALRWVDNGQVGVQGCPVMQIGSAQDALAQLAAQLVPNPQMLDYRQRPDFLQETGLKPSQMSLGGGAWLKTYVDAGEALFGYTDQNGTQMRVIIGLALNATETFMPGGGVMNDMRFLQGETLPAWIAFAPDGELNIQMAEQMRNSVQINPDWQRQISAHRAKINGDTRRTQANISDINRDANNYVSRLSTEGHNNRMAAMDRGSEAFSNMMLERENWRGADGSKINAPTGGEHMWQLDNGNFVSTNDPNLNPLAATGQFGTQLQRWE